MNSKHKPHPHKQLPFLGFPCIKMEAQGNQRTLVSERNK